MKKKLICIFVFLLVSLIFFSGCEEIVGRRIAKANGDGIGLNKDIQDNLDNQQDVIRDDNERQLRSTETISFSCNGEYLQTWYNREGNRIRQDEYNIMDDQCEGFRCLSNINEISPACYNEERCDEVCEGICLDIDEWQEECRECMPLFEDHNDLNENRINMVFVGLHYENITEFKNRVLDVLNVGGGSPGFFAETPFVGNQDKFNFWYVPEVRDYNESNWRYNENNEVDLLSKCNYLNFNYKQEIIFIKYGGLSGGGSRNSGGLIHFHDYRYSNTGAINVLLHEFGHSFGHLADEYSYVRWGITTWTINDYYRETKNINLPDEDQACEDWCDGEPVPLENLKSFDCSRFNTSLDCNHQSNNKPCIAPYSEDNPIMVNGLEYYGCMNILDLCLPIKDKNLCNSIYRGNDKLCIFSSPWDMLHPYFNSSCIPIVQYSGITYIGTQCIENTQCYYGAMLESYFRSSITSKMRSSSQPWEYVNERILSEKLNEFGGRRAPERDEVDEEISYIFFDEFDEEGDIIDGGMICLDCMEEEARNNLLNNVNQNQEISIFDKEGNVDYDKINLQTLINEYKELSNENINLN